MLADKKMSEKDYERGYKDGRLALASNLLSILFAYIPEDTGVSYAIYRADTIAALRRICDKIGKDDLSDDAYPADVIDSLIDYLDK